MRPRTSKDTPIVLRQFPNGGWIITETGLHEGVMGREIGAFGTTSEMLVGLAQFLGEATRVKEDAA